MVILVEKFNMFLENFNFKHSSTRMSVEKAYGQLKRRFPLLKNGLRFRKMHDSANCIVAAVCIYNFLKGCNDELNDESIEINRNEDENDDIDMVESALGASKRNNIADILF